VIESVKAEVPKRCARMAFANWSLSALGNRRMRSNGLLVSRSRRAPDASWWPAADQQLSASGRQSARHDWGQERRAMPDKLNTAHMGDQQRLLRSLPRGSNPMVPLTRQFSWPLPGFCCQIFRLANRVRKWERAMNSAETTNGRGR